MAAGALSLLLFLVGVICPGLAQDLSSFIPGRGCGSVTPIREIDTLPEDYDEATSDLACVFVKDKESLDRYKASLPSILHMYNSSTIEERF